MFDVIPKILSSLASFLFPLFASYKALKTSDPAQLTPWLMYWSVLSCALLVESWTEFILVWVPFYAYIRLFFLLYLVLPQTQGARHLYETYVYPYLAENEVAIEDFIASAHDRLKAAGMAYLRQAIEVLKTKVLGMPPSEVRDEETQASAQPQSYTQALLARFSVPAARWTTGAAGATGQDFFNLLAGAVSTATGTNLLSAAGSGGASSSATRDADMSASGNLVPEHIGGPQEKMSFIAQQKEKLAFVLGALDREAQEIERSEQARREKQELRPGSLSLDGALGDNPISRPPSGHSVFSALSKSKSEVDFEKIDAESGAEDDDGSSVRRRPQGHPATGAGRGAWSFLGWGTTPGSGPETGDSSSIEK